MLENFKENIMPSLAFILLLFLIGCTILNEPTNNFGQLNDAKTIELNELPTFEWIKQNTPENAVILTDTFRAFPVYVLTGRQYSATPEPQVFRNPAQIEINLLMRGHCESGLPYAERSDYAYSVRELDCPFFEIVFSDKDAGTFVYKINKNLIGGLKC